jgi:hypothetical protein
VGNDELLGSYIASLERLKYLGKIGTLLMIIMNSSSAPKINPFEVVHPSLAPLHVTNVGNCAYVS